MWRQLGLPQFDASTDFGDFLNAYTPPQQVNVIVIDQSEELFTQSAAQPRDALFNLLMHLPPLCSTRTHSVATVRADYLPELFALPELYGMAKRITASLVRACIRCLRSWLTRKTAKAQRSDRGPPYSTCVLRQG
jgi:hypothetical protein